MSFNQVISAAAAQGIKAIALWNADSLGYANGNSAQELLDDYQRVVDAMADGDPSQNSYIVLLHEQALSDLTTNLPKIVSYVKNQGYTLVKMSTCLFG